LRTPPEEEKLGNFKSSFAVESLKSVFPDLRGEKKVFKLSFQICHDKRKLSFPLESELDPKNWTRT
jgi:hypothetical protein